MPAAFKPWDIVVVPFPFTEGDAEKRRPALVVSSDTLSKNCGLYWLLMITSAKNEGWDDDITIGDFKKAGLPAPSVIRAAKIATLQEDRILRRLGSLPEKERKTVHKALAKFLA